MKRYYPTLQFIILAIFFQCTSSAQRENENTNDTTVVVTIESIPATSSEDVSNPDAEVYDNSNSASLDLTEFTKHPFLSDYPYIKNFLREEGIAFTILATDTIHSEQRIIEFDSSRIDFLDSDERFQDELGDLICSSDIQSPNFVFNQEVVIGMKQTDFLTRAELDESSLKNEENNLLYYEQKVFWDEEGYWKVIFWFRAGFLVRIQSEISPCVYEYGD